MATFHPKGNGPGLIEVWKIAGSAAWCGPRSPATERPVIRPDGGAQHPDPRSIERLGPDIIFEFGISDHESLLAAGIGIATPRIETLRRMVGAIDAQE